MFQSTEQGRDTDCLSKRWLIPSITVLQAGQGIGTSKRALPRHHTPLFYALFTRFHIVSSLGATCYASALPNPIVATGFYAARQPGQLSQGADAAATVRRAALSLRIWSGTPSLRLAATARKPDSGKVCVARGTSISQFSNADRRVSGRLRTAGSLERHQLGRAGSATLTPKNNRESCSCSKAEARLKIAGQLNCTPRTQAPKG